MNFRQYDDSTLSLHREEFEYLFEAPFKVDEFYLDDLNGAEIFDLYKEKLCRCYTIPEMMNVAKEFGFLTWGAVAALNRLSNYWVEPIKNIIKQGTEAKIKEYEMPLLAHILMPINILWGGLISDKYGLPLYYASLQYVRASVYSEGREKND